MERPNVQRPLPVKLGINVGSLMDIPTGEFLPAMHGQTSLCGGLGYITGFVGPGNCFKTTVMHNCVISAISKLIVSCKELYGQNYDTEVNARERRNHHLTQAFANLRQRNIIEERIWDHTDCEVMPGNEWYSQARSYLTAKRDEKNPPKYDTVFFDRDGVSPMRVLCPSLMEIDSLTRFMTSDIEKVMEDTQIGDSAARTIYMQQGLAKNRLLMEMPALAAASMNYFLFTAHMGKDIVIPTGYNSAPPRKQLQFMPQGEVIKGVTNSFFYLLHNCWLLHSARPFLNDASKGPEYPYTADDLQKGDADLNIVQMRQLRGKVGGSGFNIEILVSMDDGVIPYLSEYHHLKTNKYFGLPGNPVTHACALYPDVKITRPTVRTKLREDPKLCRAIEICSQILQTHEYHRDQRDRLVEPTELYKIIQEKGYDWDFILSQTRSWHTLNDEESPGYPLSTLDLCRMAKGDYHPYYLEADKKTIKKKYADKKLKA